MSVAQENNAPYRQTYRDEEYKRVNNQNETHTTYTVIVNYEKQCSPWTFDQGNILAEKIQIVRSLKPST